MRISDWSSDVCSSDLAARDADRLPAALCAPGGPGALADEPARSRAGAGRALRATARLCRRTPSAAVAPRRLSPAGPADAGRGDAAVRSEERRVGKESGSTCRSRWSPEHQKNTIQLKSIQLIINHSCT